MSTFPKYAVAIQIEVTDEQELCQAAKARAIEDGYDNVDELLRDRDGEIDVEGCLIMLFDLGQSPPGTEIEHSRVEHMRIVIPPLPNRSSRIEQLDHHPRSVMTGNDLNAARIGDTSLVRNACLSSPTESSSTQTVIPAYAAGGSTKSHHVHEAQGALAAIGFVSRSKSGARYGPCALRHMFSEI